MVMLVPMVVLGARLGGLRLPARLERRDRGLAGSGHRLVEPHLAISPALLSVITLVVVLIGVGLAWMQFGRQDVPVLAPRGSLLTRAARADLYGDAANEALLMRPGQWLTRLLVFFDNRVVDGAVNGSAAMIGGLSSRSRRWQTGFARSYALSMLGGVVLVGAALVLVRL